ncbi:DUF2807 domain-containing protein [Hymenobacter sp. J193]|uniref:head GIN domain-containing protein n=1 Tax=Hymenobacter sp. J193 TaxID=2898429 RepID=UPI002151E823|nr:head GIN domain-containing protein [Hymenobacter sp. J193]MCR5889593.1 DUF2807 domain-containing protein [Hymenobacter sp. J193]
MTFGVRFRVQDNRLWLPGRWAGLLALAGLLTACRADHELDCLKSSGPIRTTHRALPAFHTLTVYDNVDVTLVQDTAFYAEVRTGRNLQEDLELTVQDSALVIRNTSRCNWVRRYDVPREVTVHLPKVLNLFQRGENSLRTAGVFRADRLFCHIVGAGDVDLEVNCRYLAISQYELGDMQLRGRTDELHFTLGGLGNLQATTLLARDCYFTTNHDSGGSARVRATGLLGGTHSGSGTIYYTGSPTLIDIKGEGIVVNEE